jgi:excisionase family DNA binding protein
MPVVAARVSLDVGVAVDPQSGLYSVREVASQLGVHPETIRRLIHDGRLDAVRVGRVLRVHKEAVDTFLARQRVKPSRLSD